MYRWEGGPALVQTVDFFTPIVDDPYTYGQIAAANAVSDVYAMGGRPVTALAIAAFPEDTIETEEIAAIFRGGFDKLREAGVARRGGHPVGVREITWGSGGPGAAYPDPIPTTLDARARDRLLLTKPLGTGVIGTAIKFGRVPPRVVETAVASMLILNKDAAETLAAFAGVHACTDITGFGLAGHGSEMAQGSGVTLVIESTALPLLPGVIELAQANESGGMATNRDYFGPGVEFAAGVSNELQSLIFDPQTSGGLLVAVDPAQADACLAALKAAGVPAVMIGEATAKSSRRLIVR